MTHATTHRVLGTTRLRISHRTRFQFAQPPRTCRVRAYLEPLETLSQRLIHHQLEILPGPKQRWQSHDDHGNLRAMAQIEGPTRELEVLAIATVEIDRRPSPTVTLDADWAAVAEASMGPHFRRFVLPTIGIAAGPAVSSYARRSFPLGATLSEGLHDLLGRVRRDLADDLDAIPGNAKALLRGRTGSEELTCFVIACLRSLGLPTRYMQGYRLAGEGAPKQHAWASVWTGDGWLDVDPTLGRLGRIGHLLLAQGRDAAEVAPISVQTRGGGHCWRETEIQIREPAFHAAPLSTAC